MQQFQQKIFLIFGFWFLVFEKQNRESARALGGHTVMLEHETSTTSRFAVLMHCANT